ncbi:MAG TPA: PaaI family thioesterase [Gemmatimonadaceae bacterium]
MAPHFRALERMYLSAPINDFFRPDIHIEEGTATIRVSIRPDMHHAAHAAHGAVYFKSLDDAAFFAVQSLVPDVFVLTSSFQVHFLAPVVDGEMVATGKVVHQSKRLFLADAVIEVAGKVVARGNGTFMRSAITLADLTATLGSPKRPTTKKPGESPS